MKKIIKYSGYALIVIFVIIQFIPVERANPPVTYRVKWDSKQTESIARKACFDCHSNETVWPWYSYIAPIKFIVAHDVGEGREHLNFSTGNLDDARECAEEVEEGKMPMKIYTFTHRNAVLEGKEKQDFILGLKKTFGTKSNKESKENEHEEH